jgi:hypothetical protein
LQEDEERLHDVIGGPGKIVRGGQHTAEESGVGLRYSLGLRYNGRLLRS